MYAVAVSFVYRFGEIIYNSLQIIISKPLNLSGKDDEIRLLVRDLLFATRHNLIRTEAM